MTIEWIVMKTYLFSLVLLVVLGCQNATEPLSTVTASITSSQLIIQNNTTNEIYYAVFEKSILAVIDWVPICREDNLIRPREFKARAFSESTFLPSKEAVVYWWCKGKKIDNSEFYGPDELRTIILSVK
jgi:hypothetical protein